MNAGNGQDSTADGRDQFIPVRKCDITDALIEHGQLTDEASKSQFRQVCRMLCAIFHYEYFERLEMLRRDYYYFDPENKPHSRFDAPSLSGPMASWSNPSRPCSRALISLKCRTTTCNR